MNDEPRLGWREAIFADLEAELDATRRLLVSSRWGGRGTDSASGGYVVADPTEASDPSVFT